MTTTQPAPATATGETGEQKLYDEAYEIMERMGFGFQFRNCSCGQLPCARLRPVVDALRAHEQAVRAEERERAAGIARTRFGDTDHALAVRAGELIAEMIEREDSNASQ